MGSGLAEPVRPDGVGDPPAADGFLNDYPTVSRAPAVALLERVMARLVADDRRPCCGRIRAAAARPRQIHY